MAIVSIILVIGRQDDSSLADIVPQVALVCRLCRSILLLGLLPSLVLLMLVLLPLMLSHAFVLRRFAKVTRIDETFLHDVLNIRLLLVL